MVYSAFARSAIDKARAHIERVGYNGKNIDHLRAIRRDARADDLVADVRQPKLETHLADSWPVLCVHAAWNQKRFLYPARPPRETCSKRAPSTTTDGPIL